MAEPEPSDGAAPPAATCPVCAAPALPVDGACVFCGSPLVERGDAAALLDYVAARVPGASVGRAGLLHRGPVQRVEFTLGTATFRLQKQGGALVFAPSVSPERWSAAVVRAMGEAAADDAELRRHLSRAGWAWPDSGGGF